MYTENKCIICTKKIVYNSVKMSIDIHGILVYNIIKLRGADRQPPTTTTKREEPKC